MDSFSSNRRNLDDQFDALAHEERRRLLLALYYADREGDGPASTGEPTRVWDDAEREISMCHRHLPKLVDMGYVEWDRSHGEVRAGPDFAEIRPLLSILVEHSAELPGTIEPPIRAADD